MLSSAAWPLQQLVRVLAGRMGVTARASMNDAWLASSHSTMATLQLFLQPTTAANERAPVDTALPSKTWSPGVSVTNIEWLANKALATSEAEAQPGHIPAAVCSYAVWYQGAD